MIIYLLASLVLSLLEFLLSGIAFPPAPEEVFSLLDSFTQILQGCMGFVWLILPRELCISLGSVLVVIVMAEYFYKMIIWILRKIPFLGFK